MGPDDLRIKGEAHRVFIRHWLKAEKLSITITKGLLSIRGKLERRAERGAATESLDEGFVKRIEVQLMGIKGVTGVRWTLENDPRGGG